MVVRVLMTRRITKQIQGIDAAMIPILSELLVELRSMANHQPGYISGETLRNVNDPNEYVVISTWKSRAAWEHWFASEKRAEIEGRVDALTGSPTVYKVYSYG